MGLLVLRKVIVPWHCRDWWPLRRLCGIIKPHSGSIPPIISKHNYLHENLSNVGKSQHVGFWVLHGICVLVTAFARTPMNDIYDVAPWCCHSVALGCVPSKAVCTVVVHFWHGSCTLKWLHQLACKKINLNTNPQGLRPDMKPMLAHAMSSQQHIS